MDPYQILLERRRCSAWHTWPEEIRSVLPAMAQERSMAQQRVWYPPIVYIEPTNACNANCVFCPRSTMTRPLGYMKLDLYTRLIEEITALGPSEIRLFHYGEPMLHPELDQMIRLADEHGLTARFQTNGLLVDERKIMDLLDAGMNYIGVSVNGLVDADYEMIRPGHRFEKLAANLHELRRIIDASPKSCHVHLNAHVAKDEVSERDDDVQAFKKQWLSVADSLSISGVSVYDKVTLVQNGTTSSASLADCTRRPDSDVCCLEPFDRMIIKWNGMVSPCCADYDGQMITGDVTEQSVEDVWCGEPFQHIREAVRQHAYSDLALCRTCPKFYSETYNLLFVRKQYVSTNPAHKMELI